MSEEKEVLFERRGPLAIIVLNRPKALNALTLNMALEMRPRLLDWAQDDSVQAVVIRAVGERAFCAGGDIRALYDSGKGDKAYAYRFYYDEYRLNSTIHHFPKPYIAFLDGIVMGGGVGVSVHGSHRVATENIVFAMPESGIGLFPDVGGSYFLSRLPGETGMYLAMTGYRMRGADSVHSRVATHFTTRADLPALEEALTSASFDGDAKRAVDDVLARFRRDPGPALLAEHQAQINWHFGKDSVEAVAASLEADGSEWAQQTLAAMRTKSPTTMKVAFRQLREGRKLDFDDCMRMEYRLACRFIEGRDFYEGVRATIVEKDQKPRWNPDRWEDVSDAEVAKYFAPLGPRELVLD